MKTILISLLSGLGFAGLWGQDVAGNWTGRLWQTGGADTFSYELFLERDGVAVAGRAVSAHTTKLDLQAEFELSGRWQEGRLQLQEIRQLEPSAPRWCLKYSRLQLSADGQVLSGPWTAEGCQPGVMELRRPGLYEEERAFEYPGRWTGYLSQSDREYGFYFEMTLAADGTGTSHIVSEGAGGEAVHDLRWSPSGEGLSAVEAGVRERTQADWIWCLKQLNMRLDRHREQYQLSGDWTGYLENGTPEAGTCAPGTVFLTKPVLTRTIVAEITPQTSGYSNETGREVKVDRVIRVADNHLRIKVWDNGIVDGDVVTLFLNGERIVEEYRVSKRKWSIPVEVHAGENLLILHAEDMGDINPNTVAVSIDDGVEEQIIILSSNLAESGAILIQPFVVD